LAKVVVIGAGPMGLATAYQAARDGHAVEVVESGPVAGGMAAHVDFDGLSIERFYHFVCRADHATFQLLDDLGMKDVLRWVPTSMGFYLGGKLHRWGDPVSLLRLPGVGLVTKLRYGALAFISTQRDRWDALENVSAKGWIRRWCGEEGYEKFWRPLLDYKFYDYADVIGARWIWNRIQRLGRSRKSMMQEELGYLEGGSETLVRALVDAIYVLGGTVRLNAAVKRVTCEAGRATGVETAAGHIAADAVISTVPVQQIPSLAPDLPADWLEKYAAIHSIGVCCVLFKLRRQVSPHFWVNISDPALEIPGIIEFSNLRRLPHTIVYLPYYMPVSNPKFSWPDERLQHDAWLCLKKMNPSLTEDDILGVRVSRLRYAQPICEAGFAAKVPPVQTPIAGLQIADTCFYYPEDRGISESVKLGRQMARNVTQGGGA
jgi:protoporphyrinogen oxidase